MKKIGVLVHALTVEYALDVLNGIFAYLQDKKDVQFFVAQTKDPKTNSGIYEYQSWNNLSLIFSTDIDLVIVVTGSYSSTISTENLSKILKKFKEKPIISIGADLGLSDSYCIQTECLSAYDNAVGHLKNKHDCKKIAFLSANRTGSYEALMRFDAFKKALRKHKLVFNENLIFEGDWELTHAKEVLAKRYPKKESLNFDAILCANDLMALGCEQHFLSLGVKIPEELKIIGFDDSTYADKDVKVFEHKVQAYYSLRCTPQILGPIYDTLLNARNIIEDELNSACDNPIVDPDSQYVYHGGNFHGDYISLEEDKVKIALVRLCMTAERQLNYLFHDRINGILPPFLNLGTLGLNYGMQACQFTATSTTAECQTLAMPNYVHSIPNNNDNQDIVSMGTNTALICKQVVENCFQVMAIQYIALAQATDCLKIADKLAPTSRKVYDKIREMVPLFIEDTPFYNDIANVENYLKINKLNLK